MTSAPLRSDPGDPPRADDEVGRLVTSGAVALVGLAFVAAGIGWPGASASLLRLLVTMFAVMFVAGRAWAVANHVRGDRRSHTPFERSVATRPTPVAPQALQVLTARLGAADSEQQAARTAIPWSTRMTLANELRRRIAERYGLDPANPALARRIGALLSEPSLRLLAVEPPPGSAGAPAVDEPMMVHLPTILADVERM